MYASSGMYTGGFAAFVSVTKGLNMAKPSSNAKSNPSSASLRAIEPARLGSEKEAERSSAGEYVWSVFPSMSIQSNTCACTSHTGLSPSMFFKSYKWREKLKKTNLRARGYCEEKGKDAFAGNECNGHRFMSAN